MSERSRRLLTSPWAVGLLLGLLHYARRVVDALTSPLERFDEGIQLTAGWLLSQGELPLRDFYQPYGVGFGAPGALREWLFGSSLLADRLVYLLAPAALTAFVYVLVTRLRGWSWGLAAAVLTLVAREPRYSLTWLAVVGGLIVAQRAMARADGSFARGLAAHPRTFLAAGCVIALAAWVRAEYALAAAVWGAFVLAAGAGLPRARRLAVALVPVALALLPYALLALFGALDEFERWASYARDGFPEYRGLPIDLSPLGSWSRESALLTFSYVAGTLLAIAWAAQAAARALGRRALVFERDPTLVAPFLAILAAFATYAQSVRFLPENGAAVLGGIAVALFVQRPRIPARPVALAAAALLALAFLPALREYGELPGDALDIRNVDRPPESIPGRALTPVNGEDWRAEAALHALWRRRGLTGERVLATNSRNDLTYANGVYLYWFLRAKPAAWIATYDPGLADDDHVQRDAVGELCRSGAPVVEEQIDPVASSNGEFGYADHRSRRLDGFIALNYRRDADVREYRLRLRDSARCVLPQDAAASVVRSRREQALRDDDLPRAAALSILLVERAAAAGTQPAAEDVAGALLGGYWVPDPQLPDGAARAGLLALRDRAARPGQAAAATAPGGPLTRLATGTAYVTHPPPGASQSERDEVIGALLALARERPRWPATVRNVSALAPVTGELAAELRRRGGESRELERIRFDALTQGGSPREAIATGVRLARLSDRWPVEQGETLVRLAGVFDAAGESGCAARARALGHSVPGVHVTGRRDASAPCATTLPAPVLTQ